MPLPFLSEFAALDRRIWSLTIARLVVTAGFSMVMPFLAIHLTMERHVPAVIVGVIWTAAGACGAAMQWVAGELADRVGRRPLMLASMVLRALNLVAMGYATAGHFDLGTLTGFSAAPAMGSAGQSPPVSHATSVFALGALCVVNSMLRAFFDPVANAMVADLAPPAQRVAAFGLQRVGINLGWASGPAIAALASGVAYSTLFYWSAPITLLAATGVLAITEPPMSTSARPVRLRDILWFTNDKAFVRFMLSTVAFFILQAQLFQALTIYAARTLHLDRAHVGTIFTLNGMMVVFLQLPAVAYIKNVGTRRALVVGCCGYAVAYAAVGATTGYGSLLLCVAGITLAEIITSPAQQTAVAAMAPEGRIGAYSGLYGLCQIVGQSTGPLVGTAVLDAVPPRTAWIILALFGIVAALGYRSAVGLMYADHHEPNRT